MRQVSIEARGKIKGDVYRIVTGSSKRNPLSTAGSIEGITLEAVRRNTAFDCYAQGQENELWLDEVPLGEGYCLIMGDFFANFEGSKASADVVVGIFILRDRDRKAVADAVRKRFGPGSVLVKSPHCTQCERLTEYLSGGIYCCPHCHCATAA